MVLAISAKIVLTRNICLQAGLVSRLTGIVVDIMYATEVTLPSLYVWVDIGSAYAGKTFFPDLINRKDCFPIHPFVIVRIFWFNHSSVWIQ